MMAIPNQTGGWQEFGKAFGGTNKVFQDLMQRALERQKLRELLSEHAEDYGLRKEAGGRAAQQLAMQQQLAPFQLQLAKANATKAQQQLDPDYEANKFRRTMEALGAIGSNPTQRPQPFPNPNAQQFNALKEVMQNRNFQGQGAFTGQERPQDPEQFNQEQMMESNPQEQVSQRPQYNPLQIAYAKSKGIDLTKQTPEDKQAAALDLFKQKEAIKAANKSGSGEILTDKTKSKYQGIIGGAKSALPIIDNIIAETEKGNVPGQLFGRVFKPDQQATYKTEISTLLDGIRNAYTIPSTDSGTEKAEDKVLRKNGESDNNYVQRLKLVRAQIMDRDADAKAKLKAGNITAEAPKTITLYKDGIPHDVPESGVDDAIENWGYTRG